MAEPSRRILWLDGWRGLAIISVLAGHFVAGAFPAISVLGGYGVELFFVLSGRLMAEILFVARHPLPDFFRRRFARIAPALLVFATSMGLAASAAYLLLHVVVMQPWEYFSAITFTINYVQALSGDHSRLLGHIWSLAVEEHSYVLLALVAFVFARQARKARWLLAAVGLLALLNGIRLYEAGAGSVHEIYWRTDVRLAPVFLSVAVFLFIHEANFSERTTRVLGWLPVFFVPLSLALFFQPSVTLSYSASAILLALAVNLLQWAPAWLRRVLSARVMTTFGLLSYSIYLWQQPFYWLSIKAPIATPAALAGAIGVGAASYFLVERPARTWINGLRLGSRQRADGDAPVSAVTPPA
jgi:peptidoglycan/LPS O-acetylase OafA/YrhL